MSKNYQIQYILVSLANQTYTHRLGQLTRSNTYQLASLPMTKAIKYEYLTDINYGLAETNLSAHFQPGLRLYESNKAKSASD